MNPDLPQPHRTATQHRPENTTFSSALPELFRQLKGNPEPAIQEDYHKFYRERLFEKMEDNTLVLVLSAPYSDLLRHQRFRQNTNFWLLTGSNSLPDAVLALRKVAGETEVHLLPGNTSESWHDQWYGHGDSAVLEARKLFESSHIHPDWEHDQSISGILKGVEQVKIIPSETQDSQDSPNPALKGKVHLVLQEWIQRDEDANKIQLREDTDLLPLLRLREHRLLDTALTARASQLSVEAQLVAMKLQNVQFEYEIEAAVLAHFIGNGAVPAYICNVASGAARCEALHYCDNNRKISKNSLVVLDAACEVQRHPADLTTTYPSSGKFSPEQKDLAELCYSTLRDLEKKIAPGISFPELTGVMHEEIAKGLSTLGVTKQHYSDFVQTEQFKTICPHGAGHYTKFDFHEASSIPEVVVTEELKPGDVIALEPGVIFPKNKGLQHCESFLDLAVFVEHLYLVTDSGSVKLTSGMPESAAEIERYMQE